MINVQRAFFEQVYRRAKDPSELRWHRDEPPELLQKAALARKPGRALDVGCGAGTYSVWLAQHGYEVTGIDFSEGALGLARKQARKADVDVRFERADVVEWNGGSGFDLVLDSGCLHSLRAAARASYRQKLFDWLAPGGDYVLAHFERRGISFFFGPRRRTRDELITELAPLRLIEESSVVIERGSLQWLGELRIIHLWFRRE
jgi:2-polyprenyl-3-methyl-5-hydroxy-6-metoxy-1,4-benzoquinol methylase